MIDLAPRYVGRFWSKVDSSGGMTACWPWLGSRNRARGGYGQFHVWPRIYSAHRVSYELAHGEVPGNLLVLHDCDNPPCVNPAHLSVGTDADNHAAMVSRGRSLRGERNPQYKLSPAHGRWDCGHIRQLRRTMCYRAECVAVRRAEAHRLIAKELGR